ncbi:unnamed protein product [Rotaria sp. Silwood1]|nr:unnamed protein product [Rotaria sp. Silwood1]CAF3375642.1 unnamed protein product [Rotaria sp. Silwood1]CAF3404434.1 unnamed protein product [Rotaria sp. Silwood1]CAF4563719.1 unnamed protein product [Rotaria sp. Silwood1]CAF4775626.1 unnamed protein product [Rotaria sp. Silwood1]
MEGGNLTEEQSTALAHFQEFTGIDSIETSLQYLNAHDWDVERAVNTALTTNSDPPTPNVSLPNEQPPIPNVSLPNEQPPITNNTSVIVRYMPSFALQLFRTPLSFLYTFYLKFQPFLPVNIVRVAFSFFRSLLWKEPPRDPLSEIENYCTYFNKKYGTRHPTFYRGTLSQALRDAQREVRLLFVYLHDKNSSLCDRFCREVLCGEALQLTIGNNFVWSTSRDTQEGVNAARLLNADLFPCFCIIVHHGSQQTVQLKLERYADPDECLAEIINGIQHADQTLQYNRERRNVSDSRGRLLEEQNAAYLDSIRADQEKAEQRAREENERRKVEEEQQRKLQEFAEFRDRLKQTLPSEPLSTENETIQVSIRLPADEPIRRRFRRNDSAKLLFEFAWTKSNVPNQFELLWGYPRKRYQYEQIGDETIGDLMNGSTETCYLEQIDEDK